MAFETGTPSHGLSSDISADLDRIALLPPGQAWQEVSAVLAIRLEALELARATHESRHPLARQMADSVAARVRAALGRPLGSGDSRWTHDEEALALIPPLRAYLSLAEWALHAMYAADPNFRSARPDPSSFRGGFLAFMPNSYASQAPWSETSQRGVDGLPWHFINSIGLEGFRTKAREIGYDLRSVSDAPRSSDEFVRLVLRDTYGRLDRVTATPLGYRVTRRLHAIL